MNLDRLPAADRELVFRRFAPDHSVRIYGRGIRRRLPPMLGGDRRHLELVYSLLFSRPGSPVLRYGEEIGMGDELSLPGRLAVLTPMQWSAARNADFSTAPSQRLVRPLVQDSEYGCESVNVAAQQAEPGSLLRFMQRLRVAGRSHRDAAQPLARSLHRAPAASAGRRPVPRSARRSLLPSCDETFLECRLESFGYRWLRAESGPAAAAVAPPRSGAS